MNIGKLKAKLLIICGFGIILLSNKIQAIELDDKCVINILNRTIQVSADGGWALPNVPSNMGQIRARATCLLDDGQTISGQGEYFNVIRNGQTKTGDITFEEVEPIPSSITFSTPDTLLLTKVDETFQLTVTGFYTDNQVKNVTTAATGVNYSSTNSIIATVDENGLVTAKANGIALISARKDGVLASRRVEISLGGDLDGDGIPDEVERSLGLNPNDPIDALEDQDNDGLSAIEEYQAGTNIFNADTDGDGISDLEELTLGTNGIITNPLLADSDGDGIADGLEIIGGSNPNDASSGNLSDYLDFIVVSPANVALTYNSIDGETSTQLTVTGYMLDGSPVDLTDQASGTRYSTADITTASFGLTDGQIFAGQSGNTSITVTNGDKSFNVPIAVTEFDPVGLSTVSIPGYANNVDIQGDLAYVAAGDKGLQIVDVSNKELPEIIGSLDTTGVAIDVKIVGDTLYLADGDSGLAIIDVTNPTAPTLLSSIQTNGTAQDISTQGDFVFIANGNSGIEVINVSSLSKPFSVGYSEQLTDVKGIAVEGSYLVAVGGSSLALFDIEDKANPLWLTAVNIGQVKDVVIDNGYVYVAAYSTGYRVYKISESNQLELKGGDATFVPRDVAVTNGFTFFAEQLFPNVVAYVNTKNPDNPFFQDTINLSPLGDYAGTGIAIDATHAFITEESFVVSSDYKATGNTKLFIAQYRELSDKNGIAPTITLTQPAKDGATVEGARLAIAADAKDDIAIAKVEFYVNGLKIGQDSTFPYSIPYSVPQNIDNIAIRADAVDLAGTTTKSQLVTLNVQNDEDGDGLGDEEEVNVWLTDPSKYDSDDDDLSDGEEVARGINPNASDTDGDGLQDGLEVENGTDPANPDVTKPVVSSTEPTLDETEVPENSSIIINFSEVISKKSIKVTTISILETGVVPVAGTTRLMGGDQQLLFTPSALLKDYTSYTVQVNDIKDLAGNEIAEQYTFTFETGNTVDTVKPTVSSINPASNSTNIPVNAALTVVMSERINPETITAESFYVKDNSTGELIDGLIDVKDDSQTITFTPNRAFLVGRQHRIYLRSTIKDLFGNTLNNKYYYFTTAFEADGVAPIISSTSIENQQVSVPLNAKLNVRFNEAVNSYTIKDTKLFKEGVEVLVNRVVNNDLKQFSLTPKINLEANSVYSLVIDGTADLSGNLLAQPQTISFTTGALIDTQQGTLSSYSPRNSAVDVALNALVTADFSERIDPTSINANSFRLYNQTEGRNVSGDIALTNDGRRIQFTSTDGLTAGHSYRVYVSYGVFLLDIAGNRNGSYNTFVFTAGDQVDNTGPNVNTNSLSANTDSVAINAPIKLTFDEAVAAHSVTSTTVVLSDGVNDIAGTLALSTDRLTLTFTPTDYLESNTQYTLSLNNVLDVAGNVISANGVDVLTFTTNDSVDTTAPRVSSFLPASGTTDVPVTSDIVITFNETIDASNVDGLVRIYTSAGDISGTYSLIDNVLTFTPDNPLPGSTLIYASANYNSYYDQVGNRGYTTYSASFTTEAVFDTQSPTVTMISPEDGAMDIGVNTPIVLEFTESLNAASLNNTNFKLYSNGSIISPSVYRSTDGKTVTLRGTWPAGQSVSVIATDDVKDLSGNALNNFVSLFTTAIVDIDNSRPSVVRLYPTSGATSVPNTSTIVMYTSETMNESTLPEAFHVAENGVIVQGTLNLSASGQAIEFTPDNAFADGALVHVYLDTGAQDTSGNLLNSYQGHFTVATPLTTVGVRPTPSTYVPSNGSTGVVLNPKLHVLFNQEMDADYINDSLIVLRDNSGNVISTTVTLATDNRTVTIEPSVLLTAETYYYVSLSGNIYDTDGDRQYYSRNFSFTTAVDGVEDLQQPVVLAMTPSTGMVDVPLNPRYHVLFDEPINPLSFTQTQNMNVSFSANNEEIIYSRYSPLLANTEYTETISAVIDVAGNEVVSHSEQFTTGETPDVVAPNYKSYTPGSNSVVGVDSSITWYMNEAIDSISITTSNVYVYDTSNSWALVPGSVSLASDGKTIHWVPTDSFLVGRRYYAYLGNVADISGNVNSADAYYFDTNLETDNLAPSVVNTSVNDGLINVATNSRIRIQFSEAVDVLSLNDVNISAAGINQAISYSLDSTKTLLTLTPVTLLPASTELSLTVTGVKDLSGNSQTAQQALTFTTAARIDIQQGTLSSYSPRNSAVDVALNALVTADFSERIDPTSINANSFRLYNQTEGRNVSGDIALTNDGRRIQFTSTDGLTAGHSYRVYVSYGVFLLDIAGNRNGSYNTFVFTAGDQVDNTGPNVNTNSLSANTDSVAINAPIKLTFDEAVAAHSVTSTTVVLSDGVNDIAGTLALSTDRLTLTFTPTDYLESNTQYTLSLNNVLDVAGNVISANGVDVLTFTTNDSVDTTAPRVSSFLPASGTTDVPVTSDIVITFNETIDASNVDGLVRIYTSAGDISGTYSLIDNVLTFTPDNPLPGSTLIYASANYNSYYDQVGNRGYTTYSASFTTVTLAN